MNNRRLLFTIVAVLIFAVGVIIWFFFYATPKSSPSLDGKVNPLLPSNFPKRFQFLNPDGDEPESISTTEVTFEKPQVLTQIWNKPATGQTFVDVSFIQEINATTTNGTSTISIKKLAEATSTLLMFVDRTTGYIYAYNRDLQKIYQVSNTTIPGIYDAYIFNNGKRIVIRYGDNEKHTIVSVLANIPTVSEKDQALPLENITYLPSQITSVAVNFNKTALSYLVSGDSDASIYTITSKDPTLTASNPFKEWNLTYGGDTLYATSKPSAYVEGQTVRLPSFDFIVGNKTGLMSNPSPSGMFLNSMWSSKGLKTFLSSEGNQAILPSTTISSKCAWGVRGFLVCAIPNILPKSTEGLPDDWFQGRFSFEDSLVTINTGTTNITPLYTFSTPKNLSFDVTNISLSKDNSFISFNRKQDATLWLVDTNLIEGE